MPQALFTSRFDTSATRAWLQEKLDSINAVRNQLHFDVSNVARDEVALGGTPNSSGGRAAPRPEQAIYYYDAVDNGRVGFDVFEFETRGFSRDNQLHFKVSAGKSVVTHSVGPSTPRRITVDALAEIRNNFSRMIQQSIGNVRQPIPDGNQLVAFTAAMEREFLRVFEEMTHQKTRLFDTKRQFYGVFSTPLSEGFRIVRGSPSPTE
jgi:hypothetical protein